MQIFRLSTFMVMTFGALSIAAVASSAADLDCRGLVMLDNDLYTASEAGRDTLRITRDSKSKYCAALSPNGQFAAFFVPEVPKSIEVAGVDGSETSIPSAREGVAARYTAGASSRWLQYSLRARSCRNSKAPFAPFPSAFAAFGLNAALRCDRLKASRVAMTNMTSPGREFPGRLLR